MIIQVDETLTLKVSFDSSNREQGYEDDIRFAISDTAPKGARLFESDQISFLLTPVQAEKLAKALLEAAKESRERPRFMPAPLNLLRKSDWKNGRIMEFLEDAIRLGGNAIEIEHKDRRELITVFTDNIGVEIRRLDPADSKEVLKEIDSLKRKKLISIGGGVFRLSLSEYESYGEMVYRIEIRQMDNATGSKRRGSRSGHDELCSRKKVSKKKKPSLIESRISNLAQIAVELRNGKSFSITRLTTIKRLCDDVTAGREFALHISKLAQQTMDRLDTPDHIGQNNWSRFKEVVGRAIIYMEGSLTKRTAESESQMLELLSEIHHLQDTYENQRWGPVRIIASSEALVVEHALRCFLYPSEGPYWAYHLAREYAEEYDANYGNGLILKSAPMMEEIAEFWRNYYLNRRDT
jgi:hypothetical protein